MRYKGIICLILGIGGSIVSCNDDWDEHYSRNGSIPEVSLMDMILNDSQLTKFSQILMKTGADSLLARHRLTRFGHLSMKHCLLWTWMTRQRCNGW